METQKLTKLGFFQYDLKSNKFEASPEFYNIFDLPKNLRDSSLLDRFWKLIHPDDWGFVSRLFDQAIKSGKAFTIQHRVLADDGKSVRHVQLIGKAANFEAQTSVISGTYQDVTDIANMEFETKFILESMEIGTWQLDVENNKLTWDDSMYRLCCLNAEEFPDPLKAVSAIMPSVCKEKVFADVKASLKGVDDYHSTNEIITPNGLHKQLRSRGRVLKNESGQPQKVIGISWDCTKEKEMEAQLRAERAIAIHSSKLAALGEMSAGIAHEINNPLAIIAGNVHLLKTVDNDPIQFDAKIASIERAILRIEKIVSGLKKFSRSSGCTERKREQLDQIISEVLTLVETKAKSHNTSITTEVSPGIELFCNEVELEQVFLNLINNAIDAVKDLDQKWVKLKAFKNSHNYIIQIIDSGKGISEEAASKIFQPFYTTKPVGDGTGLGLSISKGILDQHNAKIFINHQMANTCFEVWFPVPEETESQHVS